jgi:hypothetical protein
MSNGRQQGEANAEAFETWASRKTDQELRDMAIRGVLSRTDIAKECGFAKSALSQNPRIRSSLQKLEEDLRTRGVLPQRAAEGVGVVPPATGSSTGSSLGARDKERLKRLEQENASLRAENAELKRSMERFAVLRDALASTGRIPR